MCEEKNTYMCCRDARYIAHHIVIADKCPFFPVIGSMENLPNIFKPINNALFRDPSDVAVRHDGFEMLEI